MILACNKICKSYGVTEVLKDVSFNINETDKVALVGVNGAGKSTLFKIILNEISKDSGDVTFKKGSTLGYLAQNYEINSTETILDVVLFAYKELIEIEKSLNQLQFDISENPDDYSLIEKYDNLSIEYANNKGYVYKSLAKGALIGLGFEESELNRNFSTLSGGEKTRVLLAKLLVSNNDILLLDEPTNHLDIKAIQWLENYLKSYNKAVFIISHDRFFLDNIVDKVIEIEHHKAKIYNGNYTDFSVQKEIDREIQLSAFIQQQKEIKRQEEIIRTFRSYATEKAIKRAKSKEKLLAKMNLVEAPLSLPKTMSLSIVPSVQSGNDVLQASNLSKSFEVDKPLFENQSFNIFREDKIAIIGDNGTGKSTLIKIITGDLTSDCGDVKLGTNVNIGYFDQENQNLSEHKTIFEEISDFNPKLTNQEIRNHLATFVFTGDEVNKKIGSLSGGEKGRVSLCKLMLSSANLLILDEPTNNLDMFSKEILESAINNYLGTIIYISHDRYFINNTATKIFELKDKKITIFNGDYDEFIEFSNANNSITSNGTDNYGENKEISLGKEAFLKQKEEQARIRKAKNDIAKIETKIMELEEEILQCDTELSKEDVYTNASLSQEIYNKKKVFTDELNDLYTKWENLQEI
ncbi:MAG: ABC-F family ATP-binding cassette domain-containing protein [Lachnospirales bacterium]